MNVFYRLAGAVLPAAALLITTHCCTNAAWAATHHAGDILISEFFADGLLTVNPVTGVRSNFLTGIGSTKKIDPLPLP